MNQNLSISKKKIKMNLKMKIQMLTKKDKMFIIFQDKHIQIIH